MKILFVTAAIFSIFLAACAGGNNNEHSHDGTHEHSHDGTHEYHEGDDNHQLHTAEQEEFTVDTVKTEEAHDHSHSHDGHDHKH